MGKGVLIAHVPLTHPPTLYPCRREWGRLRRRLRAEFAKNDGNVREREKVSPTSLWGAAAGGCCCCWSPFGAAAGGCCHLAPPPCR